MKIINNVVVGGRENMQYYDIRNIPSEYSTFIVIASFLAKGINIYNNNSWEINTSSSFIYQKLSPSFIAIDIKVKVSDDKGNIISVEDAFEKAGISISNLLTEENKITKEEFYDLTAPTE